MKLVEHSAFPDFFNGQTYDEVLGRLSRHLPSDLHYTLDLYYGDSDEPTLYRYIFNGLQGGANGLNIVKLDQYIDTAHGRAIEGDLTVDTGFQKSAIGTYLFYNNLMLQKEIGIQESCFIAENMGAYVWPRAGALLRTEVPEYDRRALKALKDTLPRDIDYLCEHLGLPPLSIDFNSPNCLWAVADIGAKGFIQNSPEGVSLTNPSGKGRIAEITKDRLLTRAFMMNSIFQSDVCKVSVGQLALYSRKIPSYFDLQGTCAIAQQQWQRVKSYMASRGYPDLVCN